MYALHVHTLSAPAMSGSAEWNPSTPHATSTELYFEVMHCQVPLLRFVSTLAPKDTLNDT